MKTVKLMVFYPHPTDEDTFELDYKAHLALFHQKMHIPLFEKPPYTVTKFLPLEGNKPEYYQMFMMAFNSMDELQNALTSSEMQEVAKDAVQITTGGAPVFMVGSEE